MCLYVKSGTFTRNLKFFVNFTNVVENRIGIFNKTLIIAC